MRRSGILMHITSLPSPYGIGTMGKNAYEFVDFLKAAGQSLWQILPLTPTGYGDSPYQSCSTYAGNPYLIDLDLLAAEGLLTQEELSCLDWESEPNRVDFGKIYRSRFLILEKAFSRFTPVEDYTVFCQENASWLEDFALFMALKDHFGGKSWYEWPDPLKFRDPAALAQAKADTAPRFRFYQFIQYLFGKQWAALRQYAHDAGIQIIGDVPIYVPLDSAEVWTDPSLFDLDETLTPNHVAGCPPDAFQADGQLWGNPLYRWDVHAQDGFAWWLRRLSAAAERYDIIRIDHFRGLAGYWAVPYGDPTARNGQWRTGPGMAFVDAVRQGLPQTQMIAEDLGFLTQDVVDLRIASGYPGMKVLGFAFDSRDPSEYLPHTYTPGSYCYTGTHDNMTTRQWFDTASPDAVAYAKEYMALTENEGIVWGVIRTALSCVCDTCVIPMQDLLNLGAEARMNFPGTAGSHNWTWRAAEDYLSGALAEKLLGLTRLYGRTPLHPPANYEA